MDENTKFPESMEEALAMGYYVDGAKETSSGDELVREGIAFMKKEIGPGLTLNISIPFKARYEYGKPQVLPFREQRRFDGNDADQVRAN